MTKKTIPLISIIVPVFDAEKFLPYTIETVQQQTYKNWELIMVDDCSKDEGAKLIKQYARKDKRIKLLQNRKNSGAAVSRNNGIKIARGDYICFLDADDLWRHDKLELQLQFMQKKDCEFSFTGYEFTDASGRPNGKKVHVPDAITYKQALKNTTISTITVMFNMRKLNKSQIYMPNVQSEDTATWWKILKNIDCAYGFNVTLSYYRRGIQSHSANKIAAARQAWNLYRKYEKMGFVPSAYYFCWYAFNAVRRRI